MVVALCRWIFGAAPLAAAGLMLLSACDRLPSLGEEPKAADAKTEAEAEQADATQEPDAKTVADAKAAADAKTEAEAKTADTATADQAKQAEVDAQAEALAAEALARAEEEKNRPVALSDVSAKRMGSFLSSSGMIEVKAKAHLNQALGSSTYVHIKSLCQKDARLIADVGYLNADYSKPLEKYTVGEEAEVKGNLYTQGIVDAMSPCQFEFRVGGLGGGLSIPIGHACWDGAAVTDGVCTPELAPAAISGPPLPIEVQELQVDPGGVGSSRGLSLSYLLGLLSPQDNSVRLTFKSACRIAGKTFVDLGQSNLSAGPFRFEPGETVARSANLYWSSAFELADAPSDCDISTSLWKTKAGSFGEYEEIRLRDSCYDAGSLRTGRCDPAAPAPPAAVALSAESVTVDDVRLELSPPYGATDKFQLKIQADVTMAQVVGQNDGVTAKVSCKAGTENRVESAYLFGVELHYLLPGETTRMTANAFGSHPLDVDPKSCKVEFFGGPRFSPSGAEGADLGRFCLKKGKVKKGGKC